MDELALIERLIEAVEDLGENVARVAEALEKPPATTDLPQTGEPHA